MQTQLSMKPAGRVAPPVRKCCHFQKTGGNITWSIIKELNLKSFPTLGLPPTRDLNFWADQNLCALVGDCGLQFAAELERDV